MNKNGFTLIELLAVIAILAVVTVIASTGIDQVKIQVNLKLLETQIESIEKAALQYGQDNKVLYYDSGETCTIYSKVGETTRENCKFHRVSDLSNANYLNFTDTCSSEDNDNMGLCLTNDVTGEDMSSDIVIIYYMNSRIYAEYVGMGSAQNTTWVNNENHDYYYHKEYYSEYEKYTSTN